MTSLKLKCTYVKSKKRPHVPPPYISSRITSFEITIRKFSPPYDEVQFYQVSRKKLFERLRTEESIVFTTTEKGLGPVAVALTQYIKNGLLHLQYEHTYELISEAKALQDNVALRLAI